MTINLPGDRELQRENLMVLEGALLLERLLDSGLPVKRIWCSPAVREKYDLSPYPTEILTREELSRQAGYNFHRGVMALAEAPPLMPLAGSLPADETGVLVLPRLGDPENLGGLLRTALGLGIRSVILGPGNPYPFGRKALRCAMGAQLRLSLYQYADFRELKAWRERRERTRTVLASALTRAAVALTDLAPPEKWFLLMGHEGSGLDEQHLAWADTQVIIPQTPDVDSLNVNVAAGIILSALR